MTLISILLIQSLAIKYYTHLMLTNWFLLKFLFSLKVHINKMIVIIVIIGVSKLLKSLLSYPKKKLFWNNQDTKIDISISNATITIIFDFIF